mgnify:CR=1 FL=1
MHKHKIYIVASTKNIRDVEIQSVYDGDIFTLDSIVAGLKDQLKGLNHNVSINGNNAYIDIIDSQNELVKTISIVSQNVMLKY